MKFLKKSGSLLPKRVIITLLITAMSVIGLAQFAGGDGSEVSPWQVETEEHLNEVRNYLSDYFIQIADIDLSNYENWTAIGDYESRFSGNYNGSGYTITNLTILREEEDYQGLFGYVEDSIIKNIKLEGVNILANRYVGGLAGFMYQTTLEKCYVSGTIEGRSSRIGGIVGRQQGSDNSEIIESSSSATVSGIDYVGGLVGENFERNGKIHYSYATGDVSGNSYVGGLAGSNGGRIEKSFATGSVNALSSYSGGLVGMVSGWVINSYAKGNIQGTNFVGGLIGANMTAGITDFCYSIGTVQGNANIGGLIGLNWGQAINSYWNVETSNRQTSAGGSGRTTNEMTHPYSQNTYAGWNFSQVWTADDTYSVNDGYPFLSWQYSEPDPNPTVAVNPIPEDLSVDVSIDLEQVGWSYIHNEAYTNPVGFRVYMNTSGDFTDDDPYIWVDYSENQTQYSTSEILSDEPVYMTIYYWKVVPTTIYDEDRNDDRARANLIYKDRSSNIATRGDAENVPIWRFTTEVNPNPQAAVNPYPQDSAADVSLDLAYVAWSYEESDAYTNPVGFRVYMNTTGEFSPEEPYSWIEFIENQADYSCSDVLPEQLAPNAAYYWQVVPTTIPPEEERDGDRLRKDFLAKNHSSQLIFRGDAQDVPVWQFTTGATNVEEHLTTPLLTELLGNYPNPFNPQTIISFSLAEQGDVVLEIYNSRGQKVITLIDDYLNSGSYEIIWDGKDENQNRLGSGVYIYRMRKGNFSFTDKMIMLK